MISIKMPYAKGHIECLLKEERVNAILTSNTDAYKVDLNERKEVLKALERPIASQKLQDITKNAKKVLIITSDHTRPVPSKITLPLILDEIRYENPRVKIKILIATGCHRPTTHEEMINKFGEAIVSSEEIINHISGEQESMVFKGILPSGGELWLNSLVDWADVVMSEGFIEPHFFAGFSGGRKSILPGIAAEKTVLANHCSKFIADRNSRTGNLISNPVHEDMLFAAKAAKLKFIVNVVIDSDKRIIKCFTGHPEKAHEKGCKFVEALGTVKAAASEIVMTSNGGYPLDQNIYQAVKGMTAAEACVKTEGVIIMVAACNDGHGGEGFYRWFKDAKSPEEVAEKIKNIPAGDTYPDQWEAQILARVLRKSTVIIVTDMCEKQLIQDMHMKHAKTVEETLNMADNIIGNDCKMTIIPDGISVIVKND